MDPARITEILTDPVTLELAERQPILQIAYAAADGSPRAVPVGYLLREGKFLFFTIPTSDKVAALHRDPRIALTIDAYPPPCCLLVRGTAELREEEGVPDEYLEASFRTMPEDQHAGFEQQVRALYDSMVRDRGHPDLGPAQRLPTHRTPRGRTAGPGQAGLTAGGRLNRGSGTAALGPDPSLRRPPSARSSFAGGFDFVRTWTAPPVPVTVR